MIDTRLILFEGPPGSGKTSSAHAASKAVARMGIPCEFFWEWDPAHPIPIGSDLQLGQVIATAIARDGEVLGHWQRFVASRQGSKGVTVLESRFWQTSVMLMYVAGMPVEGVLESSRRVIEVIRPLNPVLVDFVFDDLAALVERTARIKDVEWARAGFPGTWSGHIFDAFAELGRYAGSGLTGLDGLRVLLEEWAPISDQLYDQLPFAKIKIRNPHDNWPRALSEIAQFLGLDGETL